MSIYRDGESGTAENRTPRFYQKQCGDWFCNTREDFELGPYDTCLDAQQGLKDYLVFIGAADPSTLQKFYKACVAA